MVMDNRADLEWFLTGSQLGISQLDYLITPHGELIPGSFHYCSLKPNLEDSTVGSAAYSITPVRSDKSYIGSSSSPYQRILHHRSHGRLGSHKNNEFMDAIKNRPDEMIIVRWFEVDDLSWARYVEQLLLDTYFPTGRLFNKQPMVGSFKGTKHSTMTKKKFSEIASLRPPMTEATKEKIRQFRLKTPLSLDHSANLSKANTAKWNSPEFRRHWEERTLRKVIIDGIEYKSLTAAGKAYNVTAGRVQSRILSNNIKFVGWKYATDAKV